MSERGDEELVVLSQNGDAHAFAELVERYKGMVFTLTYRMLGDMNAAEDIAQEVFVRAYKALPRFRREAKFSTWLYRICYNLCLTVIKKRRNEFSYTRAQVEPGESVEESYEKRELQKKVRELMSELPPTYSSAITLRHIHGLSYDEISQVLGQPLGTTKSTISRAREMLKKLALEKIGWEVIREVL
ncbi:hypothetical protein AMJ40_02005 [candidate division TA06 bacterium DG_26]|uniref:RNA polymerase sigma factor n=1 Tax=candidate division TA06 bacterium DG_26 TaxID=1703771 RepID=A0A0S7WL11_UNCT6|nr:MAG: hypothetical protein AMJ40_02005 [candidate division TA06 bacterium DG_26]